MSAPREDSEHPSRETVRPAGDVQGRLPWTIRSFCSAECCRTASRLMVACDLLVLFLDQRACLNLRFVAANSLSSIASSAPALRGHGLLRGMKLSLELLQLRRCQEHE
jgi:hypothetical protein